MFEILITVVSYAVGITCLLVMLGLTMHVFRKKK